MALPGPDRPRRRRVTPAKPPRPRTTSGNRYTSPRPPKPNPKIVGRYKNKPKAPPGFVAKKRGGGLGWVLVRAPGAAPPGAPGPAAPAAPPDPYAAYAAYPWAQEQLRQIDRDQAAHQQYVTDKVQPWMAAALQNLTGVDPNQPGINPTLQQQYLSNVQGVVGGALNAAATATPMMPGATTPGGIVASPTAYLTGAAQQAARGMSSSYLQQAQTQAALNTMQPNTMAQGAVYRLADYEKGLPQLYADRRSEARMKIDQFLMEFEEGNRRARVGEAISAMNAQASIAMGLANLGLDAQDVQRRLNESNADLIAAQQGMQPPDPSTIPVGFVATPDGKGGWKVVQDPTYETPGSNKPSTRGTYTPNQLRKEGFVRLNPKAGPKWKDRATRATDGSLWIKRGSTGSTAKPKARATAADLQADLLDLYKPGDVGGWEERYDGNPKGAGKEIAYWVRQRKPDFIAGKKGRKVDWAKLRNVLARIGGRPAAEALSILTRGYINPDGTWK